MEQSSAIPSLAVALQELLGYLNFSSGVADPKFLRNLNLLFEQLESQGTGPPVWLQTRDDLVQELGRLKATSGPFKEAEQAEQVIRLLWDVFLPRYRQFHADLLFHQDEAALWRPFFLGRVAEALLRQGSPWDEDERIVQGALEELNDYIGHRPIAVLRNERRHEPYAHEWLRPIPLYVRGAGVAVGRYQAVVDRALTILKHTEPGILFQAHFDLSLLDELALDPRAYDFDHPVNKRPNYHFGQWDPHHLDNDGRYRRFVVQQVLLDSLLSRVDDADGMPRAELEWEASAVLAGTILMAAGTSGGGPDTYDSTTTLSKLLPKIAAYRDAFYEGLLKRAEGEHGERLRQEAVDGRQPFAGAGQHLNHALARRRAEQVQRVQLAIIFAKLGYTDAALHQARIVPVASARIACEIQCRLTSGNLLLEQGFLHKAADALADAQQLVRRGIDCGALVDPWNILGFQGQFSLFPSPESSVHDHRIEQLIDLLEQTFALYASAWSEAAALHDVELGERLSAELMELAQWWDKYASTSVDSVQGFSGAEAYNSARGVAQAMSTWHTGGAATGDVGFWRKHVQHFRTPKAYALVVGRLLDRQDKVAATVLLMQWVSQTGTTRLQQGEHSFHSLAQRLMLELCQAEAHESTGLSAGNVSGTADPRATDPRTLVKKFFDYLEANAEEFWNVPQLALLDPTSPSNDEGREDDEDDEDAQQIFDAAYDEMVFVDSTDDGYEGDVFEPGAATSTEFELEQESRRLRERLLFVATVARLWRIVVLHRGPALEAQALDEDFFDGCLRQAEENERRLLELMAAVHAQRLAPPAPNREALLEYDRRRSVKDALLEAIIATTVETVRSAQLLRACRQINQVAPVEPDGAAVADPADPEAVVLRAVLRRDAAAVRQSWDCFVRHLHCRPLLYVPVAKGGDPKRIVQARWIQQFIRDLLQALPRLGLLKEACALLQLAREMEVEQPMGPGAVTEFDRMFDVGYKALVETLVVVSEAWPHSGGDPGNADAALIDALEQLTDSILKEWLGHSRTLRLSALEKIPDENGWQQLVEFIKQYGHDLLTQSFLNFGNLRAILHQGVDAWLAKLQDDSEAVENHRLLQELDAGIPRADAVRQLTIVMESIVENYAEYRDYNTTTTQSDRGEQLYMLLDFLRVRVHYDRVAWHLRPVILAHEVLVRHGRMAAAEQWQQAMAERTSQVADNLQQRLSEMRKKYGMRLPTVADRIGERFVRPLAIDRIRALVQPALDELRARPPQDIAAATSFPLLEQEAESLAAEPAGVGLDVPVWLQALEEEVDQARTLRREGPVNDSRLPMPQIAMTFGDVMRELGG